MGVARAAVDVQAELLALTPSGWAIDTSPDSMFAKFVSPLSAEISRFEEQAQAQLSEVDQRNADYLLTDYERVLGPDPYGRAPTSLQQRRQIAYQRWTSRGGQSIAYFVGLAATLGVTISIAERRTSNCGRSRCGAERCAPTPAQFVWIVTLPQTVVQRAICGASRCGAASVGTIQPNPVQPAIERDAPAHTLPIFSYVSQAIAGTLDAFVLDTNVLA